MRLNCKHIIVLFLAGFIGSSFMQAQEQQIVEKSEIVMTQSELDSLLAKIVKRKKEQLAKEKKGSADLSSEMTDDKDKQAEEQKSAESGVNDRIDREFDRLHRRIDFLIMNMSNNRQPVVYGQTESSDDQARMIYNVQPNQAQPVVPGAEQNDGQQPQPQSNLTPGQTSKDDEVEDAKASKTDTAGVNESAKLQKQINDMNEKLRVLDTLGTMSKSGQYDEEIAELRTRIEELKKEEASLATKSADSRDDVFKEYAQTVFFANNSTEVKEADDALDELLKLVEEADDKVMVMLHGFASKSGSAQYNNKISFERADAVKQKLLDKGLKPKNIVTIPHGSDGAGSADDARRVEISLRVL